MYGSFLTGHIVGETVGNPRDSRGNFPVIGGQGWSEQLPGRQSLSSQGNESQSVARPMTSVIQHLPGSTIVTALGCESGISKSEVSRICQGLDTQVQAFLNRPLEFSRYPYVYLDATYLHGRDPARKQVISRALIVAVGITATGQRKVLGNEVGDS